MSNQGKQAVSGDGAEPRYSFYLRTHRSALVLVLIGALLEASAITVNYTFGLKNPLDECLSFASACVIVVAGSLVVFQLGYAARLVPVAAVLFIFSKALDITRSIEFLNTVPLIGLDDDWTRIIKDVAFVSGGLLLLLSFIYSALEAHRAQYLLRCQNEDLLKEIEERKKAEEALRKSEQNARAILDATSDRAFLMDIHGTLLVANDNLARSFGKPVQAILGRKVTELLPLELAAKRWEQVETAIRLRSPVHFQDQRDRVWLNNSVYPILGEDGAVVCLAVFSRDITNEVNLERQLRQSQKMEAVGRLAGGIAHDFRNTLLLIMGHCELALRELPENHPVRGNIRYIINAGKRASGLVKQILTFSRREEQEHRPVQILQVVKEAMRLIRATLPATIEVRQRLQDDCGIILSDATQIHQVVVNLCNNAHQAMGQADGVLEVSLEAVHVEDEQPAEAGTLHPGHYVRLRVSDTGSGIDASVFPHIFDPFFTTKKFGEGTGLGLSTVHGIVTASGGAILVSSEPGRGSTFSVYLPRHASAGFGAQAPEPPVLRGSERILLLEDDEDVAFMTAQMLCGLGYAVETRANGIEGLELLQTDSKRFDVIIADNIMPQMTGIELARESLRRFPAIPVILVTGYSEGITPEQTQHMGIAAYISKPFSTQTLSQTIRQVLDATSALPSR